MSVDRTVKFLLAAVVVLCGAANASAADFILFGTDDGLKIPLPFLGFIPHASHAHVWTLADTTLRIAGAREEWVACQVAIHAQRTLLGVNVTVSDLVFQGHKIPADSITLYREHAIRAASVAYSPTYPGMLPPGNYRDALIPFEDPYPSAAGAVGVPFDVAVSQNAAVWLDIHIPRGIPAGTYRGTITVTENTLALPRHVFLEVTVWDFTIPRTTQLPMVVGLYPNQLAAGEEVTSYIGDLNDEFVTMLRRYERMAREHRFDLDHRFITPDRDFDPVTGALLSADWTDYDNYIGPVIEGTIFDDGAPPNLWMLPFEPEFLAYPFTGAAEALSVTQYAAEVVSHFQSKGWPLDKSFVWIYDEPAVDGPADSLSPGEIAEIQAYYVALKAGSPLVNVLVTEGIEDSVLVSAMDWIGSKGDKYYPPEMQGFQAAGYKTFFYQSYVEPSLGLEAINTHGVALRTWPWIAWKYHTDGHIYWCGNYWHPTAPYDTADGQPQAYNDGNGTLFYPGNKLGTVGGLTDIDGPLSSVRMKNLRRGRQDVAYLELLTDRGFEAFADSVANALVASALCAEYSPTGAFRGGKSHYQGPFVDPRGPNGQWPDSASNWYLARKGMGEFLTTLGEDSLMAWVIQPNAGDTLLAGAAAEFVWQASGASEGATADLFLSPDGGLTLTDTLALGTPNDGQFTWTPTADAAVAQHLYFVARVCDGADCVTDVSDQAFMVSLPFTMAVLQNPVLTRYLDIYVVAWDGVDDATLVMTVDGDTLVLVPTDPEEHVYHAQFVLPASGDLDLEVCGRAAADGLLACLNRSVVVELARPGMGATLRDAAAVWSLHVLPTSVTKSIHITVVEETRDQLPPGALAVLDIGPPGMSFVTPSELRIRPEAFGLPGLEAGDVRLVAEGPRGAEELATTVDPVSGEVVAHIERTARVRIAFEASGVPSSAALPTGYYLQAGEPNPTQGEARLRFALPRPGKVELAVYDVGGRLVRVLDAGDRAAGTHDVVWDGLDDAARPAPSGVYFVWLQTAGRALSQKLLLVR